MRYLLAAAITLATCTVAHARPPACPPAGYDRARLEAPRTADWAVADDAARAALARALVACVASPDTVYRDRLGYESLRRWMRAGALDNATLLAIADDLQARLTAREGPGFERPFAALILSEVARTDRLHPWMTPARRASLLDAAITYLTGVRDYRGFDDREGWRHGVPTGPT